MISEPGVINDNNKKIKVFFTLDTLANAGTEKSTLDILSHFSANTEAKVIHFFPGFDLKPAYESAGIPLIYAGLSGKRSFMAGTKFLLTLIKKEKPDLVVSSIMRANFFSRFACLITKTKLVGTFVNDSYGEMRIAEMKRKNQYKSYRFFWLLDRWTSGIPKYWISNARSIAESNAKALHLSLKKIKVIYRGRETSVFPQRTPLPVTGKFRFVFVGRLLQRKGLDELMAALVIVRKKFPGIWLDIYGDGTHRKRVEALVKQYELGDIVQLHGAVPNGWRKLYEAHCFVFPSWYEGFSGALVEAMFAGIPIIASDISMNLEAVDGTTALIHPVKNAQSLADRMVEMILHYEQMVAMGERARAVAMERFDINIIARQYENFLHNVVTDAVDKNELLQ